MEKDEKIIGMNFNVVQGLNWLIFVFGIVALAVDHAKMTKDQKRQIVQVFVFDVISGIVMTILSIVGSIVGGIEIANIIVNIILMLVVSIFILVVFLIAMIKAFQGKYIEMPICYNIASAIIKDDAEASTETKEAATEKVDIAENTEETKED